MALYTSATAKTESFAPPKPVKDYPKDSIKKITVLFTDIVGSSQFFKTFGDVAGTRMLKQHQDLVSPAIAEHGGAVVKFLGDSVMAYFMSPKEALKSGIKIQQRFKQYNLKRDQAEQIHIRLCIHYGNGIVEEKDIFGDVVNMAAKLLPLVDGDQILVSQEVQNQVKELPLVYFEQVKKPDKKEFFNAINIYQVLWDEKVELQPLLKSMLYIKPLFKIGRSLSKVWDNLLRAKNDLWTRKVEKEKLLPDRSIALLMDSPAVCLETAKSLMELIKVSLGYEGVSILPVQMVIDTGPFLIADRLAPENLEINWEGIEPGAIYISAHAYKDIGKGAFLVTPLPAHSQTRPFYRIGNQKDNKAGVDQLFLYQNAMIQGENSPCFYCGDKRHLSMHCPSKDLTEMTQGLEQLGYFSLNEINNMYFQFLTSSGQSHEPVAENSARKGQPTQWANLAFYDLRAVYQLRFFRAIWDSKYDEWNKIKEKKNEGDKGGMAWIGQDCLRVGNHEQAESILNEILRKDAYDYKIYCALGLLKMEQDNFYQAELYFKKALNHCKSGPQSILLNFLLARLFALKGDLSLAEDRIRKILHLDPFCHEAIYQEIIFQFKKGRKSSALSQLIKLIKKSREYFINALIDPELSHYNDIIHPSLRGLLNEAKSEALQHLDSAKVGLERLDRFLGPDAKEVMESKSLWNKIEELLKKDSYFGYLDMAHYAGSIIHMSHAGLEERRKKLIYFVNDLNRRLDAFEDYLAEYPHKFLMETLTHDLRRIRQKIEQNINIQDLDLPQGFKESMVLLDKLQKDLDQNEAKIMRLETFRKIIFYISRFSKACLIFQTANLFISLVLFPIITYYLSFVIPRFNVNPQSIWSFQKSILILCTISGLFLSILYCTKRVPKKRLPFR